MVLKVKSKTTKRNNKNFQKKISKMTFIKLSSKKICLTKYGFDTFWFSFCCFVPDNKVCSFFYTTRKWNYTLWYTYILNLLNSSFLKAYCISNNNSQPKMVTKNCKIKNFLSLLSGNFRHVIEHKKSALKSKKWRNSLNKLQKW